MKFKIRLAHADDALELIRLNQLFDDAEHVAVDVEAVRQSLLNHPTERVFVVALEGELAGFATLQMTRSFCYDRPTAELTGLFVMGAYRRHGFASGLIQAAKAYAESVHSLELFLRVNQKNDHAIRCYAANGFSEAAHYEYQIKYYGD